MASLVASYIKFPQGKPWQAVLRVLKYRGEGWAVLLIIILLIKRATKYTEVNPITNHSPSLLVYWLIYPYDWM